ncbi:MAG: hypothetical protein R6U62_04605 [Bacteroidales bacterium]
MKKLGLAILIVTLALPVCLFAHSPGDITLSYEKDEDREVLIISVAHSVRNVERHYVESISISVNDEELEVLTFSNQDTDDYQDVEYEVPGLSQGDAVEIKASCNRIGSATEEFVIE